MPQEDIREALTRHPFEPFQVHLSDGTVYDIRHPELVMVGMRSMVIGVPARDRDEPIYERYHIVALSHVVRLEPAPAQSKS